MKNLFDQATVTEIKTRLHALTPASKRSWGTMTVAQMVEHCARGLELATGDRVSPRLFIGRAIGWIVKPLALNDDAPMRRNSPTIPDLKMDSDQSFDVAQTRLNNLIDRFTSGGRAGCTTHPHSFFGRMTPDEWGILMYKHLDHHLRQFGV